MNYFLIDLDMSNFEDGNMITHVELINKDFWAICSLHLESEKYDIRMIFFSMCFHYFIKIKVFIRPQAEKTNL